jgi:hypothetical protein
MRYNLVYILFITCLIAPFISAQSTKITGATAQLQKKMVKTDVPRRDTAVFGIKGCSRIVFTGPTLYHIGNYQHATMVLNHFIKDFKQSVNGLDTSDYPLGASYFCIPNGKRQLKLQNPDFVGDKQSFNEELKFFLDSLPNICYQLYDVQNSVNMSIYLSSFKELAVIDTFARGKTWNHIFNDSIKFPISVDSFLAHVRLVTNPVPLNHAMQRFRHSYYDQLNFVPEMEVDVNWLDSLAISKNLSRPYIGPGDVKGKSKRTTVIGVSGIEYKSNFWPHGLSLSAITMAKEYAIGTTVELPIYRQFKNYVPISWWYGGISTYWSSNFLETRSGILSTYSSSYQIGWMYIQNQGMEEPISLGFEIGYMPGKSKNIPDDNVWIPNESLTFLIKSNRAKYQFSAGILCETQILKYNRVYPDPNSKIKGSGWAPVIRLSLPL